MNVRPYCFFRMRLSSSTRSPRSCSERIRRPKPCFSVITADGTWFLCLYAQHGIDFHEALRAGASDAELADLISATWLGRIDRGAEERLGIAQRAPLYQVSALRADPRREMHTRGG